VGISSRHWRGARERPGRREFRVISADRFLFGFFRRQVARSSLRADAAASGAHNRFEDHFGRLHQTAATAVFAILDAEGGVYG